MSFSWGRINRKLMSVKQHFNNTYLKFVVVVFPQHTRAGWTVFDNSSVLKSGKHFSSEYLSKVVGYVDTTGYRLQRSCYHNSSFEASEINRSSFTSHLPPAHTDANPASSWPSKRCSRYPDYPPRRPLIPRRQDRKQEKSSWGGGRMCPSESQSRVDIGARFHKGNEDAA